MNTKRISMVAVMGLVLAAAALTPSPASAQKAVVGKFTLSCTTYWGNNVLPAGDYTFSAEKIGLHATHLSVRGAKNMDVLSTANNTSGDRRNAIELKRSGATAVVTNMYLAKGSIEMSFRTSPSAKELLVGALTPPRTERAQIIVTE
jgi:hypothetical protein